MASESDKGLNDLLADALNDFTLDEKDEDTEATCNSSTTTTSMNEVLKMLNEQGSSRQQQENNVPNEEELEKMFTDFANSTASGMHAGGADSMVPILESMMKSVLSKELLYPPLKELSDKYPDWLADQRQSLGPEEFKRYNGQYTIVRELVEVFESDEEKNSFDQVLQLMQKMQSYGHPPKELIGNAPPLKPSTECPIQ